jgi:cytochrome c oxidase subunit 2
MEGSSRLVQSALEPAGAAAATISQIWTVLLVGSIVIFVVVMALTLYVLVGRGGTPRPVGGRRLIIGGGVVFPIVALTALLIYVLPIGARLTAPAPASALQVEVTGKLWWWDVRYLGPDGTLDFATANELTIPVGRPVEVLLRSDNVVHSFWVPSLAGKMDLIPGRVNRLTLSVGEPVAVRGQCAEYCGSQHAWMAFDVVALPEAEFAAWVERQREPTPEPRLPTLARGREVFIESGCGACHHVRGLAEAPGGYGPDLSNVGSRATLAAGLLPNNIGSLAGWIANPQALKPGTLMPAFDQLPGADLRALAAWLESLE